MRILLVEDDELLGDALVQHLRRNGHAVDWLRDGLAADTALLTQTFGLVVLDLGLPRVSGKAILQRLRDRRTATPVMIITAQDALSDRVSHLDAGADDYLVKPFALAEFDARLRALLRRSQGHESNVASLGRLQFDRVTRTATVDGERLDLSAREVDVLETLLASPGRVAGKEQILDHLCTFDADMSRNAVEVYVHRLRKKLEVAGLRIVTVRGLGYFLDRAPPG